MPFTPKQLEGFHSYECSLIGSHDQGNVQQIIRIKRDVERKFLGCLWPVKGLVADTYYYQASFIRNDVVEGRTTHIYEMEPSGKEDVKFLKDYVKGLWAPVTKE